MGAGPDLAFMAHALRLAEKGLYTTTPNPRVGCLIVRDGEVVGEGWHERAGAPHAEVNALAAAGARSEGATAYVTFEPCSHHGRTPPCADALIAARVRKVVSAMQDPNPEVSGRGLRRLRDAGIEVEVGVMEQEARDLNAGFVSRMTRGRPWLRLKVASGLDGKTALENGVSQWITGAESRRDVHHWRARSCAVMTGIGTLRDDDPRLTVREIAATRQPLRIVVDSRLRIPLDAKIFDGGGVLVATAFSDAEKISGIEKRGGEVIVLSNAEGKVDLGRLVAALAARGLNEITVEAGMNLNTALYRAGVVDELLIYYAPVLLGDQGRGMLDLGRLTRLEDAPRLELRDVRHFGRDLRILARFGA